MTGLLTSFGMGFLYFISAIPAGVAANASLLGASISAWAGYSAGGLVVLVSGVPLRSWITKKLGIAPRADDKKLLWRIWSRFGMWGLGLIAPVSIGPQAAALLALSLGERPSKIQTALTLGAIPWVICLSVATSWGVGLFGHRH